MDVLKSPNV